MDPAGILMLRSVRIIFEIIGLQPELIKFKKEEFTSETLVDALTNRPKKCPAIVSFDIVDAQKTGNPYPHVVVATNALEGKEFIEHVPDALRHAWFINCKNSYRDDSSESGTVLKDILRSFSLHGLCGIGYVW